MRERYFTRPVLYNCRQYSPGDLAPDAPEMIEAWEESGSVRDETPEKKARAQLMTAEPGRPGKSSTGDPDALLGKVPKRGRK